MRDYLCKCNGCDSILIDENPRGQNGLFFAPSWSAEAMVKSTDEGGEHWACPNCQTDGYLMDFANQNEVTMMTMKKRQARITSLLFGYAKGKIDLSEKRVLSLIRRQQLLFYAVNNYGNRAA